MENVLFLLSLPFLSESKTRSQSSVVPYIAVRGTVSHNNNWNDRTSKQTVH
jgi:hypothetical protein